MSDTNTPIIPEKVLLEIKLKRNTGERETRKNIPKKKSFYKTVLKENICDSPVDLGESATKSPKGGGSRGENPRGEAVSTLP